MNYIYIIKNVVNSKVYIGKTCKSIKERFAEHISLAKTSKSKRVLYQAMNKYNSYVGFDNCNGYNMTLGGDGQAWTDYAKVVEVYLANGRNITKTAKILKCAKKTVHRACDLLNIKVKPNMKKVYLYDADGNLLQEFPFIKEAINYCKENNINGYDKLNR